ncbi:MAG: polyphosphate:AMP phosphotransferase [Lachnospiraceae bacterium]
MLEKIDTSKKMDKSQYQERMLELEKKLGALQRECRTLEIPIMIAFEGLDAAGKGLQIGQLIHSLDPRGFQVYAVKNETKEECRYPFLWRFWTKMPEKGRIAIYDTSWYRKVLVERYEKKCTKRELAQNYDSICSFEQQITEAGGVLIKLFLMIDQKEQKKRLHKLLQSKTTSWRVSKGDIKRNKQYKDYLRMNEEMLQKTDTEYAPWSIIEATDRRFATVKIYTTVIRALTIQIDKIKKEQTMETINELPDNNMTQSTDMILQESTLSKVDLTLSYTKEEYTKRLKALQKKIKILHGELYRRRIPVVIGFEGWDAGGKGGAIKRLTDKMDPRGYVVNPTCAPNDLERAHHYLWRFWNAMPKTGHIAIFDRTWYGRVMVERVEGFCTTKEWQRAYKEINDMEANITNAGGIVLKFWMQIDKDEQEKRFHERQENPDKQWKITDEDWRNRKKWDQYETAVNEMLIRTSTPHAPWIVVEANSKYYARIKVLETVIQAIEQKLSQC